IRVHGQGRDKYENVRLGLNARLDTIQAAVVLAKMEVFDQELELRQQVARRYNELLSGAESLVLPRVPEGSVSAWAQYTLLAESEAHRARLIEALAARGVPTALYYPRPLHLQAAFAGLGYVRGELPVCEDFSARVFSLPMHPYLDPEDQERAASAILAA
ncbi:MAG: DegT/DnrJ/EryC1/StrS family aminotransferase, partial [Desulfovibrionaceae bacterium]|nr:DegT/DnrJ/EryC1/StrS family aminotransferase [Desulfovibrionaceae bacterium]